VSPKQSFIIGVESLIPIPADDCNIYVNSKKAGERVMASLINFIVNKLKLKVNRKKSGKRHC
jgi:hypothetical protein